MLRTLVWSMLFAVSVSLTSYASGTMELIKAAERGDIQTIKAQLTKGVDVYAKRGDGATALIMASWKGHNDIVKALIAKGANGAGAGVTP